MPRAQAALFQLLGDAAMSIFRTGAKQSARPAGLYRSANPDGGQRSADSDRVGRIEARAERHLVQQLPDHRQQSGGKGGGKGGTFGGGSDDDQLQLYCFGDHGALRRADRRHQSDLARAIGLYAAGLGLSLFTGTTPQTVWSYLATAYPSQALAYQGTAYVCAANYNLERLRDARQPQLRGPGLFLRHRRQWRRRRSRQSRGDFLTNAQYGVGFPAGSIDATTLYGAGGDASYQTYCAAVGLALSPALDRPGTGLKHSRPLAAAHQHRGGLVGRASEIHSLWRYRDCGRNGATAAPFRSCCPRRAHSARRRRRSM